jgi:protein-S-isoprenylcysteine O-methyltransferase Ste14
MMTISMNIQRFLMILGVYYSKLTDPCKTFQSRFHCTRLGERPKSSFIDKCHRSPPAGILCPRRLSPATIVLAQALFQIVRTAAWLVYRLGIVVVVVVVYPFLRNAGWSGDILTYYIHNPIVQGIGAGLVYAGVAIAVWARYHLGSNWGMPMSEKEGAELVTTGPYAYVRNPIYSGVLLAIIGAALSLGLLWAIAFVPYAVYLIPSVFGEEKIMARLFPDTYPAYKARTKRLIPWVW